MTKLPHFSHRFELLQTAPQCRGPRLTIGFATQKTSQLSDPPHRLAHCGRALRYIGALMYVTPKRLPLGGWQPIADRIIRQFPRRLAQGQDTPGHHQVYRQDPLQPLSCCQLSLLDVATTLKHFVDDFDLPTLRIDRKSVM